MSDNNFSSLLFRYLKYIVSSMFAAVYSYIKKIDDYVDNKFKN